MNTNKHTFGLWHFRTCTAGDGKPIVTIDSDVQADGGLYEICRQYLDDEPKEAIERIQADFRLIAATPEMLETLERCEFWFSTLPEGKAMQELCRAIITKAKGEA